MEFIWGMSNTDIAKISWYDSEESRERLEWEVVVDLWAWVGWFLSSLWLRNSNLYEVDPVYQSEDWFNQVKVSTLKVRREYLMTLSLLPQSPKVKKWVEVFSDLLNKVINSSHEAPEWIERVEKLEDITSSIDTLFCTYVFTSLGNPKEVLREIEQKMSPNWKILIIENSCDKGIIKFLISNIGVVK